MRIQNRERFDDKRYKEFFSEKFEIDNNNNNKNVHKY